MKYFHSVNFCKEWTTCKFGSNGSYGDILDGVNFSTTGAPVFYTQVERTDFCKSISAGIRMMPAKETYDDSFIICGQLKSDVYTFKDSVANTEVAHDTTFIKNTDFIWTGYNDRQTEKEFVSSNDTSIDTTNLVWKWGEPNGDNLEQCAILQGKNSNLVMDVPCDVLAWVTCDITEFIRT